MKNITFAELVKEAGAVEVKGSPTIKMWDHMIYINPETNKEDIFTWLITNANGALVFKNNGYPVYLYSDDFNIFFVGVTFYGINWDYVKLKR